ncbi:hypothetical protein EDD86DRAFT_245388 [Gorgonomyces haynaldii]|nr:hypothetical protein EDD86DRAFT_245388 [Gorgonomyces haynaldii]
MTQKETVQQKRERIQKQLQGQHEAQTVEGPPLMIQHTPRSPIGATGLQNLGNTCFMNSAIQCLSHTVPLTNYFLSGDWKHDLNRDNPLGLHGKVPEAYYDLVRQLWNSKNDRSSSFAPRQFKYVMGELNSTFQGYGQQDSHELLSSLLDGLHEDLNRIKKKEYLEDPEMGTLTLDEFAKMSWEHYRKRNDSVIVDYFQAQLKSRTECQVCHKESIKFDPYMYLQLPIPESSTIYQKVTIVPLAGNPVLMCVKIPRNATIAQFKMVCAIQTSLTQKARLDTSYTACVELWNNAIFRVFSDRETIAAFGPSDIIVVAELGEVDPLFESLGKLSGQIKHYPAYFKSDDPYKSQAFAQPLMLTVPSFVENETEEPLDVLNARLGQVCYRILVRQIARYCKVPVFRKRGTDIELETLLNAEESQLSFEDLGEDWEPIPKLFKLSYGRKHTMENTVLYPKDKEQDVSNLPSPKSELSELATDLHGTALHSEMDPIKSDIKFDDPDVEFKMLWSEEIQQKAENHPSLEEAEHSEKTKTITLEQCIAEFNREELLDGNDVMYCSQCKEHRPTKKRLTILVIHLKRFSNEGRYRSKIGGLIDAPITGFDATQFLFNAGSEKSELYDLFAVSNHFGGLDTAYCLNPLDNKWYDCDDSRVSPLQGKIMTSAAYLLFYRRRSSAQVPLQETLDNVEEEPEEVKEEDMAVESFREPNVLSFPTLPGPGFGFRSSHDTDLDGDNNSLVASRAESTDTINNDQDGAPESGFEDDVIQEDGIQEALQDMD